ncbi:MAG: MarR family winged helix-turn-helix transcriptional regulator, partial [Gemmatimonadaceae bacterium]
MTQTSRSTGRQTLRHTPQGARFTELVLEVLRLNGLLIAAGNQLSEASGLTSARWQVLGAIALAGTPLTVSQIARSMGLTRQGVHRVIDELAASAHIRRTDDPHSLKARPVTLTDAGKTSYAAVTSRQIPWANRTAGGIDAKKLASTVEVL